MEEKMEGILKQLLEEKIEDYLNEASIERVISEIIDERVRKNDVLRKTIDNVAEELVIKRIEGLMEKPVTIDNGWGKRKTYESLDDLIKEEIQIKISGDYDIKNRVQRIINDRVNEFIKQYSSELLNFITGHMNEKLGLDKGETKWKN